MGRTILTATELVYEFEANWKDFSRSLREADQEAFADLVAYAHFHAASISYAKASNPFEPFLLAMLVELVKRIQELERTQNVSAMIIDAESELCDEI